jgi:hypothetical protein
VVKLEDLIATMKLNGGPDLRRADREKVMASAFDVALTIKRTFDAAVDKIRADQRLTAGGRAVDAHAAGNAAREAAGKHFTPLLDGLDRAEQQVRAVLGPLAIAPSPSDPGERMEAALLRQEVRRQAEGLDDGAIESLYRSGGPVVRRALEELPRFGPHGIVRPYVRPEVLAELRETALLDAAKTHRPDLADQLHDIAQTRELYTIIAGNLQAHLAREAPEPPPAPASASRLDGPIATR